MDALVIVALAVLAAANTGWWLYRGRSQAAELRTARKSAAWWAREAIDACRRERSMRAAELDRLAHAGAVKLDHAD